ncbi:hypothetical protein DL93DRAFT_2172643 [Clavulina sp. PMI_390]|nr:hypothetical protein DL93DRAFT_2172643 [Clavulina sp. PMI_390]
MFRHQGLFQKLRCPDVDSCTRTPCPFSHKSSTELPRPTSITDALSRVVKPTPIGASRPITQSNVSTSSSSTSQRVVSLKREAPGSSSGASTSSSPEPPRKIQKVVATTTTGAPRIQANPMHSKVPVVDRQKLLSTMYDIFRTLYASLLMLDPGLPARHALAQELEIYDKASRSTYRNVDWKFSMITTMASIKKRPHPDSLSHPSVGTSGELAERAAKTSSLSEFKLKASHLEYLVLSRDDMILWEYVVDPPPGPGGDRPSEVGNAIKCERCDSQYVVTAKPSRTECVYHWGRAYGQKVNGVREAIHRCCSMPSGSPGCQKGPHVFSEKRAAALHSRHPFSSSESTCPSGTGTVDICAIDCEMIYTTAGMSMARVSGVNKDGAEIFDYLVRMDKGVDVVDYNTRFSGITSLDDALLDLDHARQAIGAFVGPNTIIIGHALENDLKTLRMIHNRVVDTATLYKHQAGAPYRRSLRELSREYLGIAIQTGDGTTGHSSLEDARATLDLVKCWVIEHPELRKASTNSS